MTTEVEEHATAAAAAIADDDSASAAAAKAAVLSSPVAYFRDALTPRLLAALRRDAEGLACCSNFWIPREVLAGKEPPLAAFEQAAAAIAQRCLEGRRRRRRRKAKAKATEDPSSDSAPPPLHPLLSVYKESGGGGGGGGEGGEEGAGEQEEGEQEQGKELLVSGAECWCQLYESGRGLDPHYDKDEEASARGERPLRHPQVSTVVYLNGPKSDGSSFGATVVVNQRLHPRSGAPLPAVPTSSALLWPRRGASAAFDGRLAHCVLPSSDASSSSSSSSSSSCPAGAGAENDEGEHGENESGERGENENGEGGENENGKGGVSVFDEGKRATVLFNFWCGPAPGGVLRVTEDDISAAKLTRPVVASGEPEGFASGGEGEANDDDDEATLVPPAVVAVPRTDPRAFLCLLDELLLVSHKARDHPFVVVSHPGYELVEAEVVRGGGGGEEGGELEGEEEGAGTTEKKKKKKKPSSSSQIVFIPLSDSSGSDS